MNLHREFKMMMPNAGCQIFQNGVAIQEQRKTRFYNRTVIEKDIQVWKTFETTWIAFESICCSPIGLAYFVCILQFATLIARQQRMTRGWPHPDLTQANKNNQWTFELWPNACTRVAKKVRNFWWGCEQSCLGFFATRVACYHDYVNHQKIRSSGQWEEKTSLD